jgi:ubiquitin-protein ligase E3 C
MQSSFFGPQRSRQINLGGATTTASHAAILDKVKAQREERLDSRRRLDSAVKLQAWWRGTSEARRMRAHIRAQFDRGSVDAVQWTRWLVVGWGGRSDDWDRLGSWSSVMVESGEG